MSSPQPRVRPRLGESARRVFGFSLGEMLWSRRTIFMALVVASPVVLAVAVVALQARGVRAGTAMGRTGVFGMMIWVLYLRFIVPVLGVFYGTALIADEVDDRTITYLFTRPISRGAVLIGKYLAYLVCTSLVVLPSVMVVYFTLVPFAAVGSTFTALLEDMGILALGLAVYGALFGYIGAVSRRPLVAGLVFAFGWEPVVVLLPGYVKWVTVAFYLQALVPHPMAPTATLLQAIFRDLPSPATAIIGLLLALAALLALAVRAVQRREYVLEQ